MPMVLDDGVNEAVTLKAAQLMKRKKWRLQNIPLMQMDPYCFDMGLETDEVEVVVWVKQQEDYEKLEKLRNPVKATSSNYPEVVEGWYRMEKVQVTRKAAYVNWREGVFTLLRDFWVPLAIVGRVVDGEGDPMKGVVMHLTGDKEATVRTRVDGSYIFAGLKPGDYTVTPEKEGWSFTPSHRSYSGLSSDALHEDYTGSEV